MPPSSLPQWDTNLTNTTPLVAGHKTDGFATNEVPSSAELNTWLNLAYLWLQYLSAGFNLIPNTVTISDAQHDNLDLTGGTNSFDNRPFIILDGGGTSTSITGIAHGASGRVIVIQSVLDADCPIVVNSPASTGGNRIAVNDKVSLQSIRLPHNGIIALWDDGTQWFVIWSSFPIDSAPFEVIVIPAGSASQLTASTSNHDTVGRWDISDTHGIWYPIVLPAGSVVNTWKFYASKSSDNTKTVTAQIQEIDSATFNPTVLDTKTNVANAPGAITLKNTGLNYTVTVGKSLVGFIKSDKATASFDFAGDLEISYTRRFMPAPTIYTP